MKERKGTVLPARTGPSFPAMISGGHPDLYEAAFGQPCAHGRCDDQDDAGRAEGDPVRAEGLVAPTPQPGTDHGADLVSQECPAVEQADNM